MSDSNDRIQALVSDLADRVRAHLSTEITGLADALGEVVTAERETAATAARAEAEAGTAAAVALTVEAERAVADERVSRTVESARQQAQSDVAAAVANARASERQADLANAERLLQGVRALDAGQSLSDVLETLVIAAAGEAPRAALLLARDGRIRGWRLSGAFPASVDPRAIDLAEADAGILTNVVQTGQPATVSPDVKDGVIPAPLTPSSAEWAAVALPIVVDGRTVAILYADDAGEAERDAQGESGGRYVPSAWPELVEVLTRHASRCLEALTARKAPELSQVVAFARPGHARQQDEEAAQRYARLLVSEIRLYHEPLVDEGRRASDLLRRLRPQIERAQRLYDERVAPDVRSRTNYFHQELVRTLADGNAALLGQTA
jgi:hypothetical protein